MSKKITTKDFVLAANKVHKNKYSYKNTVYVKAQLKVIINCPIHGQFTQTPNSHLNGKGCRKCSDKRNSKKRLFTKSEFVTKVL